MIQEFGENANQTGATAQQSLAKELLAFSVSRDIKYLFKYLLSELDILERDGAITGNSKEFFRKRVLDRGNSCLRNLESELEKFEVSFRNVDNKQYE